MIADIVYDKDKDEINIRNNKNVNLLYSTFMIEDKFEVKNNYDYDINRDKNNQDNINYQNQNDLNENNEDINNINHINNYSELDDEEKFKFNKNKKMIFKNYDNPVLSDEIVKEESNNNINNIENEKMKIQTTEEIVEEKTLIKYEVDKYELEEEIKNDINEDFTVMKNNNQIVEESYKNEEITKNNLKNKSINLSQNNEYDNSVKIEYSQADLNNINEEENIFQKNHSLPKEEINEDVNLEENF